MRSFEAKRRTNIGKKKDKEFCLYPFFKKGIWMRGTYGCDPSKTLETKNENMRSMTDILAYRINGSSVSSRDSQSLYHYFVLLNFSLFNRVECSTIKQGEIYFIKI